MVGVNKSSVSLAKAAVRRFGIQSRSGIAARREILDSRLRGNDGGVIKVHRHSRDDGVFFHNTVIPAKAAVRRFGIQSRSGIAVRRKILDPESSDRRVRGG